MALNSGYHLAYLIGAGLVLIAIAVALSVLRSPPVPEGAPELVVETVKPPAVRARPQPAYATAPGGCEETGMQVVIGCGGCTGSGA